MDPRLLAFVGVAALLTLSPGPDMALVLRNALARGRDAVLPTALGTCSGCVAWGVLSSIGIAAVVNTSAQLYDALRLAGAAYLAFLGVRTLWDVWGGGHAKPQADGAVVDTRPEAAAASRRTAYRQGLLTNLLNPKVGIFYTTFLPQFISPGQPAFLMSLALASIHAGMNLVWLSVYGRAAVRLGDVIRRGRIRKAIETASGSVLVAFGIVVAAEQR